MEESALTNGLDPPCEDVRGIKRNSVAPTIQPKDGKARSFTFHWSHFESGRLGYESASWKKPTGRAIDFIKSNGSETGMLVISEKPEDNELQSDRLSKRYMAN